MVALETERTGPLAAAGAPSLPLLATKFAIPAPSAALVPRSRLTARLKPTPTCRLALVVAPAGSGKSSVVSQWCHQNEETPVTWLSLDANDNEPIRFLLYVSAALERVASKAAGPVRALLQLPEPPTMDVALTLLLNGLAALEHPVALVLDDYHEIEAPLVHRILAFLLEHLPPTLSLILTSRIDPPLPLSRLRIRGQLVELRAKDLSFTDEEATRFLNERMGLSLAPEAVARLAERTEGWIAGVQLAALSLQGRPNPEGFLDAFAGSNRYVVDYLFEEVLGRQPYAVQQFLLQTSILDRLCGPLCEAVTGMPGGQAMFERLEAANLFLIPLDEVRRWYRYHHLFADALQARLQAESADRIAALHGRAAAWFEEQGMAHEAIEHALAGGQFDQAASLLERHYERSLRYGQQHTLGRWLQALPASLVQTRPLLTHALAAVHAYYFRIDDAEQVLNDGRFELRGDTQETRDVQGKLLVVRGSLSRRRGDKEAAIATSRRALELLAADDLNPRSAALLNLAVLDEDRGELDAAGEAFAEAIEGARRSDGPNLLLRASYGLGKLRESQGALREAARLYHAALAYARERNWLHTPAASLILAGLGRLHYQWNDLPAAHACLEEAFGNSHSAFADTDPGHGFACQFELLRVKRALGDTAGAEKLLDRLSASARATKVPWFDPVVSALRVRWKRVPEEAAAGWLAAFEARTRGAMLPPVPIPDLQIPEIRELEIVTWAELRLAQGRAAEVGRGLEQFLEAMVNQGRHGSAMPVRVCLATLYAQLGRMAPAIAVLEPALTLAEREGYVRVFADAGIALFPALRRATARGIAPEWGGRLLAALGAASATTDQPPGSVSPSFVEPLSEREREVLRLLAAGHSNATIAGHLFLSVGTVKRHVHNIYGKLGATSRTSAAARARTLCLL